jgi:hypothetical protein
VKVLDLDNELDDDATPVSRQQRGAELERVAEEMHKVFSAALEEECLSRSLRYRILPASKRTLCPQRNTLRR